ncbi:snRNA-activating protein complex subunit 4 isoform X2 [Megalops cyprinoides]|uniref:snRNA-activating protein complex subunit 4 isoform X2 n=1 Tax=Megalops cyprinoides TaxID=118141 RepID=UPI0018653C60|nr:snRNA-activating protein complex subunit 4 isoform X2 [Megalops cyprinoides]
MESREFMTQRDRIKQQIEALERCLDTDGTANSIDMMLSSSSSESEESYDEGAEDGEQRYLGMEQLVAKRYQIQQEIEEIEGALDQDMSCVKMEILSQDDENDTGSAVENNGEDSDEEFGLPENAETCLQLNLVYQEVLQEKLTELEHLLVENQEQQKELMTQVCGPDTPQASSSGLPPLKVFLGNFMKPYFKDRVTGLGPPANPETREKMNKGTRTYDEMKIKRWAGWQKTLLFSSVISDSMKRQLQPKLSKVEYLNEKMIKGDDVEKQILQKQINQIEREIEDISSMTEEQLMGSRRAYHDWEKISNIDFEGTRSAEDIKRFWENYLHPSINKSSWKEDEIEKLKGIVEKHNHCNWDQIAEELGTNRTAFMCLQTHQRYIHKGFKKKAWTKEEDQVLKELVEKMRVGNFIPYTQISYFIEGREAAQLIYRWTQVLDPSLRKGHWTKEEDEMLLKAVAKYGVRDWWKIRNEVPGRNDGQCRDRYLDCLSGDVKKGRWSREEEAMLINLVEKYGAGRWSKIASEIPNRIDSQCLQKWKSMTRYRCKKSKCHKSEPLKKRERKRKKVERRIKRQRKEEDMMTSSEEEDIVFMDSEEELAEGESDLEQICREEYILPRIDEWIPKKSDLLPCLDQRVLQTVQTKLSNQITSQGKVTRGRACSVNSLVPPRFPAGVRNTIVDQFGGLVTSNMGMQPAQKDRHNEKDVIKVSLCEVRNLLRRNQGMNPRHRIRRESQRRSSTNGKGDGPVQDRRPECSAMLNNELLLAITPWVGNLLVTMASRQSKHCQADVVRETAESLGLTSTPVFSLFLKILSIDAEGCKKVIEGQNMKESGISGKQVPAVTPSLKTKPCQVTSHNRTVAQLLYEKRRQVYKKKKGDQKKTPLFMPYLMIPQSVVFTQPLLQETQPPLTSADNKSSVANSEEKAGAQQSQKRIRKPTEKALALKADSKVKASEKSRNHKKACLKNICPKVRTDGDSSQVSLTPPFINWIVTPNGILPVNGIGIQIPVVTQPPAVGTKEVFSNMSCLPSTNSFISQQSSLTFPVKADPGAEPPSKLLKVSPSPSIKAASPVSSGVSVMEERAVLKPAPSTYTSTNTPEGGVIYTVPNTTGLIHSTSSSRLVSLSQPNTSCSQITLHTLTPRATSTILSVPISVNTVPSIPVPPHTVSQKDTHVNPALPHSQHLPTLPVFQPHTPGISGNCPVSPPAPGVSPSQQRVVHILQPRHPPLTLSSKHGMQPKPEPISFDPSLMFLEDVSQLNDWMKGAMVLPQLDMTLPYLPPFVSSLTTLATLLKCKMDMRKCALPLVTTNGESDGEEPPENAIRQLVAERLSSNPAYVLLKARFLSCFTLPAFLATIPPCRKAKPPTFITSEDSKHEEDTQPGKYGGLLRIDGEGAVAAEFSGISTRH